MKLPAGNHMNVEGNGMRDGWNCDNSRMYGVGKVGVMAQKLIDVTYEAMVRGSAEVKPGARLGDIGWAIQSFAEGHRFSVVRDFCGHGIGKVFHDSPSVLHFGNPGTGTHIREGMFFTIEPMINEIGRASCRERVWQYDEITVVAEQLKKKKKIKK